VFRPARMTPAQLEEGYWRAYREFYRWSAIVDGAMTKPDWKGRARHFAYAAGWKKFEPLWDLIIRAKRAGMMLPVLEMVLAENQPQQREHAKRRKRLITQAARVDAAPLR